MLPPEGPVVTLIRRNWIGSVIRPLEFAVAAVTTSVHTGDATVFTSSKVCCTLKVPVTAGQKLLLVNEATGQAQECRVLRTACRKTQELEVAVAFSAPHPDFWDRLEEKREPSGIEKRALPRVALPRGMDVTWKADGESMVSRVQTISAGGLSIATPEPPGVGELIQVRFDVPAGEVNARAIVRHARQGEGMGVEFIAISQESRDRLDLLLRKLLH